MLLDIVEPGDNSEEKKKEIAIGIDLGTTNSLIAISNNQSPKLISDMTPSIVKIDNIEIRSIKRLMGKSKEEADELLSTNPELHKYLRKDSDDISFKIGNNITNPIEISSKILSELKLKAEKELKENIHKAVITIPAYFDDASRNETKQAAEIAGFEVLRLIAEPTAAAYAYGLEKDKEGLFLVYDLGGGTFDVSLLNMQMGVFQVISTAGDINLGGDDIDSNIANYLAEKYNLDYEYTLPLAKKAKEHLGNNDKFICEEFSLTTDEFNNIIKPIIEKTISILEDVIDNSEKDIEDISGIIMVGGSTRIRLIKEIIKDKFDIKIFDDIDPDKIVALGAALQAENLTVGSSNLLIDVTPLSLGIEIMGGLVDIIISRNSALPASNSMNFTTHMDNQTGMKFHIVQGDRAMARDCRSLTRFELLGIPPMKAKMAKISVNFHVDVDGILSVSAIEELTGSTQNIILKPSYGIDEKEIAEMLKIAFKNAKEDHKLSLLVKIKSESNDLLAAIKKLKDSNDILEYIKPLEKNLKTDDYDRIYNDLSELKKQSMELFNQNLKSIDLN